MKRGGKTLPERLGSIAWRYQVPAIWLSSAPISAWTLSEEASEEGVIGDGPTARTERLARLEAVLFLAREPLGSRKLAEYADLADGTQARTLVRKLNRLYDTEGCAFRVVEVAGGFQLVSRPQFASYLRRVHGPTAEVRLSAPAMETLSVVAYRQPVLRVVVESIRGVQCGELLRQLMERDLVRIAGRSEELGRPFLYGTTKRFLQVFGLRHLDELPPVETEITVGESSDTPTATPQSNHGQQILVASSDESPRTVEEPPVKIEIEGQEIVHPVEELSQMPAPQPIVHAEFEDDSSFDDDDEYDDDDGGDGDDGDEDEDYDYEDDFEDSEDEDEDDGFEDSEWEEVGDDEDVDDEEWEEEEWEDDDEEEGEEWEDDDDEDEDEWD